MQQRTCISRAYTSPRRGCIQKCALLQVLLHYMISCSIHVEGLVLMITVSTPLLHAQPSLIHSPDPKHGIMAIMRRTEEAIVGGV